MNHLTDSELDHLENSLDNRIFTEDVFMTVETTAMKHLLDDYDEMKCKIEDSPDFDNLREDLMSVHSLSEETEYEIRKLIAAIS